VPNFCEFIKFKVGRSAEFMENVILFVIGHDQYLEPADLRQFVALLEEVLPPSKLDVSCILALS